MAHPGEQTGEKRQPPCRALLQEQGQYHDCGKAMCRKTLLYKHAATCRSLAERRVAYDEQTAPATPRATSRGSTREGTPGGPPEGQAWALVHGHWRTAPLTQWAPLGYGPRGYP